MRLMALPPPPPTPITLITAPWAAAVSNENVIVYFSSFIHQTYFQLNHGSDLRFLVYFEKILYLLSEQLRS